MLPGESVESAVQHIRKTIADERVTVDPPILQREPSSRLSATDSEAFTQLHRTIREIYPNVLVAPFVVVAGTDATHYDDQSLTGDIYRFVPWRLGKDDLKRIHGVNERLSRDDFLNIVRFYERLIRNTAAHRRSVVSKVDIRSFAALISSLGETRLRRSGLGGCCQATGGSALPVDKEANERTCPAKTERWNHEKTVQNAVGDQVAASR